MIDLRDPQVILRAVHDISPLLRTETLKDLLIELFFRSPKPRTLSDLARAIDVDQTTVMREVNRLLETGVVTEERIGRSRTIAIDRGSPISEPLRRLVRLAKEPEPQPVDSAGGQQDMGRSQRRRPLPSAQRRPA